MTFSIPYLTELMDGMMAEDLADCRIDAAAVSITLSGRNVLRRYYGAAQEGMIYRLASMTKPITAAAVLMLAAQGKLKVDEPVSHYLPEYGALRLGRIAASGQPEDIGPCRIPLTIRHLLTHTGGLMCGPLGLAQYASFPAAAQANLAAAVAAYPQYLLSFEPGTQAAYSAVAGFDVLARIVEIVSQESYPQFLYRSLFHPLGMNDTVFAPNESQWARMASMHVRVLGASGPQNEHDEMGRHVFESFPLSYPAGGAALAGTLEDYERFALMLLNKGGGLLPKEAIHAMSMPQVPAGTPGLSPTESWGLGVRVTTSDPVLPPGSFGWSGAYGTHFWVDPQHELTCVYMKNSRYDGGSEAVTARRTEQVVMKAVNQS